MTDKGKSAISNFNLCIRNDGSNTYLHPAGNISCSFIDQTIVDPSVLLDLQCSVHDDLIGSDYFPFIFEENYAPKTG